jgi:hypothetical protein
MASSDSGCTAKAGTSSSAVAVGVQDSDGCGRDGDPDQGADGSPDRHAGSGSCGRIATPRTRTGWYCSQGIDTGACGSDWTRTAARGAASAASRWSIGTVHTCCCPARLRRRLERPPPASPGSTSAPGPSPAARWTTTATPSPRPTVPRHRARRFQLAPQQQNSDGRRTRHTHAPRTARSRACCRRQGGGPPVRERRAAPGGYTKAEAYTRAEKVYHTLERSDGRHGGHPQDRRRRPGPAAGTVDLTDTHTTHLADHPQTDWPRHAYLNGFTYERFASLDRARDDGDWDPDHRAQWLAPRRPDRPNAGNRPPRSCGPTVTPPAPNISWSPTGACPAGSAALAPAAAWCGLVLGHRCPIRVPTPAHPRPPLGSGRRKRT